MHFSSFCTTNYVPLERFDIIYTTVSLKPLGFIAKKKKRRQKIVLKLLEMPYILPTLPAETAHSGILPHSFTFIHLQSFYLGRA